MAKLRRHKTIKQSKNTEDEPTRLFFTKETNGFEERSFYQQLDDKMMQVKFEAIAESDPGNRTSTVTSLDWPKQEEVEGRQKMKLIGGTTPKERERLEDRDWIRRFK